jgi:glucose-6-phosphate 1-dehydrogenase
LVLFGGAGDLARRMLFPALYNLKKSNLLPDQFKVIGVGRRALKTEDYRRQLGEDLKSQHQPDSKVIDWLMSRTDFIQGDTTHPETYAALKTALGTDGNTIYYLATPPSLFSTIPKNLAQAGLLDQNAPDGSKSWRRIIVEKPFGRDWESARRLNQDLLSVAGEDQIYRIDHYLGKETVQNIMVMRFANGTYEPIWNRRYIDSVQITVAESLGVEGRGEYYDQSGALRDMVPNHLFQLISLIGMEPPNSFDANDVRDEKVKLLEAVKALSPEDVLTHAVRGQYDAYQHEHGIRPHSATETFAAMKLEVDNWRWAGVPFYLRTGKRLAGRLTEVIIQFRQAPIHMFREVEATPPRSNLMVIQIQPDERIQMRFNAKVPGPQVQLGTVVMDFDYLEAFGNAPQTGYETLLFDCMRGDATLFQRADQIEAGWKIVQPILDVWGTLSPRNFPNYEASAWGPKAADELLTRDGRQWLAINCCEPRRLAA